mmetsp:Transcript_25352/g.69188  ORF Transcript_25352/g.69188 Transcript_25352/m.69188 type:complete len:170 (+) Transcript_25352:60-569(+)
MPSTAAWHGKVRELADRGVQPGQLLDFYAALGAGDMPHFHPGRSTTNDVVRQAIIPASVPKEPAARGVAWATMASGGGAQPADHMVTHSWDNLFSHLVAAVVADALGLEDLRLLRQPAREHLRGLRAGPARELGALPRVGPQAPRRLPERRTCRRSCRRSPMSGSSTSG